MARALLFIPHFWEPIRRPLRTSSLDGHAEAAGRGVDLFGSKPVQRTSSVQRETFEEDRV